MTDIIVNEGGVKVLNNDEDLYRYLVRTGDRSRTTEIAYTFQQHGRSAEEATKKVWQAIHEYEKSLK